MGEASRRALRTVEAGYELRPQEFRLDVDTFVDAVAAATRLREQADLSAACSALDEAMALWRNEPLLDVPGPFALSQRGPRVALLHGVGGVGKTALATRFGREVQPAFPDGQLYLDLRGFASGA